MTDRAERQVKFFRATGDIAEDVADHILGEIAAERKALRPEEYRERNRRLYGTEEAPASPAEGSEAAREVEAERG